MLEYSSVVIRHGEVSGRVRLARTTTVLVMKDLAPEGTMVRSEDDTLKSNSVLYFDESLWTYGFIRALLKYCRMDEHYVLE
ncbi:hypothetical protein PC113_g21685 [Phytophthora cactorum]|uniref:Uncharacterized protein n=1 Tax=Phytophthora cactorum TaxID=29920 RepID=A0A8T0Y7T3_9STRA|nr:hypothetical protein PC113_g21685 [Phytophthora cactorum]